MKNSNISAKKRSYYYRKSLCKKTAGFFSLLLLLSLLILNACKKDDNPDPDPVDNSGGFEIIEHTELDIQDIMDQLMLLPDDPENFDYHDFYYEATQEAGNIIPYFIAHDVVKYESKDNNGDNIELTGLFIYPWKPWPFGKVNCPIISVNHGTELLKKYVPSKWKYVGWNPLDWGNFMEVLIADIMASYYGWVIVMPDYQGMGDDLGENHPYCVREKLAVATADMVQKAIETIDKDKHKYVKWNGKTFLYGFSEGGFVTMAATKELEARNVTINGTVCMDGPYDLTGTMLDVMLSDDPFPVPYFLPMFFVGYHSIYKNVFSYEVMLKDPYKTDIPMYTTGFYPTSIVNGIMPADGILKKVFTDAFIDSLKSLNSQAHKILNQNNAFENWTPKSKMLLWHCKNDDCVPFGNFTKVKNEFGTMSNIEYVEWPPIDPIFGQTIHVSVAPRAFWEGAHWIYHQTK